MGSQTLFRGPVVNAGPMISQPAQGTASPGPFDGPTLSYQGLAFPDVRYSPIPKDAISPAVSPAFFASPVVITYDGIPQATASNALAAAQVVTSGVAVTLNTVVASTASTDNGQYVTYGVPIIPNGTSQVVIVQAIDFGFATGTCTANSSAVVVSDVGPFAVGQWLAIGGVGNSSSNTALLTQITAIPNATTLNISPVAATARTRAPIGQAAMFNNLTPPASSLVPAVSPAAATNDIGAGFVAVFDPRYGAGRNISVSASTTVNGTSGLLVSGYDVHGYAMTELITANGTTAWGNKAFKYVRSITPQATGTALAVGLGDTFGFALRADSWGLVNVAMTNATGGIATTARGFTAAIVGVSTATTGDVRGTIQTNTGTLATSVFGQSPNGTQRLTISQWASPAQVINANPASYTSLFGVGQA